jgi:hypothetical protein
MAKQSDIERSRMEMEEQNQREQQRLQLEQQKLNIERERIDIERNRMEMEERDQRERERIDLERQRLDLERQRRDQEERDRSKQSERTSEQKIRPREYGHDPAKKEQFMGEAQYAVDELNQALADVDYNLQGFKGIDKRTLPKSERELFRLLLNQKDKIVADLEDARSAAAKKEQSYWASLVSSPPELAPLQPLEEIKTAGRRPTPTPSPKSRSPFSPRSQGTVLSESPKPHTPTYREETYDQVQSRLLKLIGITKEQYETLIRNSSNPHEKLLVEDIHAAISDELERNQTRKFQNRKQYKELLDSDVEEIKSSVIPYFNPKVEKPKKSEPVKEEVKPVVRASQEELGNAMLTNIVGPTSPTSYYKELLERFGGNAPKLNVFLRNNTSYDPEEIKTWTRESNVSDIRKLNDEVEEYEQKETPPPYKGRTKQQQMDITLADLGISQEDYDKYPALHDPIDRLIYEIMSKTSSLREKKASKDAVKKLLTQIKLTPSETAKPLISNMKYESFKPYPVIYKLGFNPNYVKELLERDRISLKQLNRRLAQSDLNLERSKYENWYEEQQQQKQEPQEESSGEETVESIKDKSLRRQIEIAEAVKDETNQKSKERAIQVAEAFTPSKSQKRRQKKKEKAAAKAAEEEQALLEATISPPTPSKQLKGILEEKSLLEATILPPTPSKQLKGILKSSTESPETKELRRLKLQQQKDKAFAPLTGIATRKEPTKALLDIIVYYGVDYFIKDTKNGTVLMDSEGNIVANIPKEGGMPVFREGFEDPSKPKPRPEIEAPVKENPLLSAKPPPEPRGIRRPPKIPPPPPPPSPPIEGSGLLENAKRKRNMWRRGGDLMADQEEEDIESVDGCGSDHSESDEDINESYYNLLSHSLYKMPMIRQVRHNVQHPALASPPMDQVNHPNAQANLMAFHGGALKDDMRHMYHQAVPKSMRGSVEMLARDTGKHILGMDKVRTARRAVKSKYEDIVPKELRGSVKDLGKATLKYAKDKYEGEGGSLKTSLEKVYHKAVPKSLRPAVEDLAKDTAHYAVNTKPVKKARRMVKEGYEKAVPKALRPAMAELGKDAGQFVKRQAGYGLKKGSPEAKEFMRKLRERKSKGGKIPGPPSRSPITDPSLL